ncbi:heavy-metal-associated domain-containing protein [Methanolobus zinderi]|jgi:copper ion binding protein|uniref:Heavy-metal-associated domain-containing protein n=1 Tax=Methanolobus zinderi TaxID=536044 RepID=A0A7D5E760_9EURY|nr:copper ion binding protein [Methanolobus zinderi]QLC49151.1 heavy-metal-associated domain-containing protein [Methanolobus zinderi]
MTEDTIRIEGMACGHCQATVDKAIKSVNGVQDVNVDLENKQATVTYDPATASLDEIKSAVSNAGYTVVE